EIFIGAIDTSSTTILWVPTPPPPHIVEALKAEIDSLNRLVEEGDVPKLPYLNAIIKETLRLHPLGPLLPREVQQQCEIRGFLIPENTPMFVNVYQIMRDPDVLEDPLMFVPERLLVFSEPDKVKKYIPFGSGRRACPCAALGTVVVMTTAVAVMVYRFDWNIEGGVDMEEHLEGAILTLKIRFYKLIMTYLFKFSHVTQYFFVPCICDGCVVGNLWKQK
ncbi:hypothetical protein HID58_020527, partial [Brassica napus]